MHQHSPSLILDRVERVRRQRIAPALRRAVARIDVVAWEVPGEPITFSEAVGQEEFLPFPVETRWGRPWGTTWLKVDARVPDEWVLSDGERVELEVDLGFHAASPGFQAEALVYDAQGRIIRAVEPRSCSVPLAAVPGESVLLWIEAASNPDIAGEYQFAPTADGDAETASTEPLYIFQGIRLVIVTQEVWELDRDLETVTGLISHLPADRPRAAQLLAALVDVIEVLDPHAVAETAGAARAVLTPHLRRPAAASAHTVVATGHAHIDSAWLWPVRETIRKCARTFSNALALMDDDDEFVFACSSAQQFEWVRVHYPELFSRILDRVAEGRFVPVGGMWVESDTNMPGSEAMVRQFVEGGSFFRDVLGVEAREVWLPDSFGYSAALPQIAVAAGARWFLTQKMSWNDTNVMPHHTFWWEGIDGTRVFTHFPPADTYNSDLSIADLDRAERQFAEKAYATTSLLPFGFGNGGGGPTREMLAAGARARDVEGAPRVEIASPAVFFTRAEQEYAERAPVWSGEMYLELHRGVYSSQARTKRGNRRAERLLHDAELWATTAMVREGLPYPGDELRELWRTTLLQQFHDILPGSSIAWVHREAERNYDRIAEAAEAITTRSVRVVVRQGDRDLHVNSTPVARGSAAAMSIVAAQIEGDLVVPRADGGEWILDNGVLRVRIDADGLISSCVDLRTGREIIAPGARAGVPELFRDTPTKWDAWDLDLVDRGHSIRLLTATSVVVDEREGESLGVTATRMFGASCLQQRYTLRAGAAALDIEMNVDWREDEKMLKLRFPLGVVADSYDSQIQFGQVTRAIHANTSWDAARFEVCAHRYVRVGEPGLSVAVINDATYGHDVSREIYEGRVGTLVRPTLLRAPRFPDPDSDRGEHKMRFRLAVGGSVAAAAEGYALADVPRHVRGAIEVPPLVAVEGDQLIIETVKAAEDGSGDVVLRVYEPCGGRASTRVTASFPFARVLTTDVHERGGVELRREGQAVLVEMSAFQMRTLRFVRAAE